MKCSKCRKLLIEFSEGRLEGELGRTLQKHIENCASCRQELDSFQSSLELMDAARRLRKVPYPPADFVGQVMQSVAQNADARIYHKRLAFGVLALCCLLALGALLFPSRISERQSMTEESSGIPAVETDRNVPDYANIRQTKVHIGTELARLLGQALEVIERGEQQWEIEI